VPEKAPPKPDEEEKAPLISNEEEKEGGDEF